MRFSKTLTTQTIGDAFPVPKRSLLKTRLGIELEIEGLHIPNKDWRSSLWMLVPEGSLRNGYEFVSSDKCTVENLPVYMEDLAAALKGSVPDLSIRTSTHLHVNVSHFTIAEVYAVLGAYYLMEDTLVKAHGKPRTGNLFCLRARDAEGILDLLVEKAKAGHHLVVDQNLRYGALNLNALMKFNTVEFRFMKSMPDVKELQFWVEALFGMVQAAKKLSSLQEVIFQYKRKKSLEDFFSLFFSNDFIRVIRPYLEENDFITNLVYLDKVLKKLDNKKKMSYNFTLCEDIDEFAVKNFDVQTKPDTAPPTVKRRSASLNLGVQADTVNMPPWFNVDTVAVPNDPYDPFLGQPFDDPQTAD